MKYFTRTTIITNVMSLLMMSCNGFRENFSALVFIVSAMLTASSATSLTTSQYNDSSFRQYMDPVSALSNERLHLLSIPFTPTPALASSLHLTMTEYGESESLSTSSTQVFPINPTKSLNVMSSGFVDTNLTSANNIHPLVVTSSTSHDHSVQLAATVETTDINDADILMTSSSFQFQSDFNTQSISLEDAIETSTAYSTFNHPSFTSSSQLFQTLSKQNNTKIYDIDVTDNADQISSPIPYQIKMSATMTLGLITIQEMSPSPENNENLSDSLISTNTPLGSFTSDLANVIITTTTNAAINSVRSHAVSSTDEYDVSNRSEQHISATSSFQEHRTLTDSRRMYIGPGYTSFSDEFQNYFDSSIKKHAASLYATVDSLQPFATSMADTTGSKSATVGVGMVSSLPNASPTTIMSAFLISSTSNSHFDSSVNNMANSDIDSFEIDGVSSKSDVSINERTSSFQYHSDYSPNIISSGSLESVEIEATSSQYIESFNSDMSSPDNQRSFPPSEMNKSLDTDTIFLIDSESPRLDYIQTLLLPLSSSFNVKDDAISRYTESFYTDILLSLDMQPSITPSQSDAIAYTDRMFYTTIKVETIGNQEISYFSSTQSSIRYSDAASTQFTEPLNLLQVTFSLENQVSVSSSEANSLYSDSRMLTNTEDLTSDGLEILLLSASSSYSVETDATLEQSTESVYSRMSSFSSQIIISSSKSHSLSYSDPIYNNHTESSAFNHEQTLAYSSEVSNNGQREFSSKHYIELFYTHMLSSINNQLSIPPTESIDVSYHTNIISIDNQLSIVVTESIDVSYHTNSILIDNQLSIFPTESIDVSYHKNSILIDNQLSILPTESIDVSYHTNRKSIDNQLSILPTESIDVSYHTNSILIDNQLSIFPTESIDVSYHKNSILIDNQLSILPTESIDVSYHTNSKSIDNQLSILPTESIDESYHTNSISIDIQFSIVPTESNDVSYHTNSILTDNQLSIDPTESNDVSYHTNSILIDNQLSIDPTESNDVSYHTNSISIDNPLSIAVTESNDISYHTNIISHTYIDKSSASFVGAFLSSSADFYLPTTTKTHTMNESAAYQSISGDLMEHSLTGDTQSLEQQHTLYFSQVEDAYFSQSVLPSMTSAEESQHMTDDIITYLSSRYTPITSTYVTHSMSSGEEIVSNKITLANPVPASIVRSEPAYASMAASFSIKNSELLMTSITQTHFHLGASSTLLFRNNSNTNTIIMKSSLIVLPSKLSITGISFSVPHSISENTVLSETDLVSNTFSREGWTSNSSTHSIIKMLLTLDGNCTFIKLHPNQAQVLYNSLDDFIRHIVANKVKKPATVEDVRFESFQCIPFSIIAVVTFSSIGKEEVKNVISGSIKIDYEISVGINATSLQVVRIVDLEIISELDRSTSSSMSVINQIIIIIAASVCVVLVALGVAVFVYEKYCKHRNMPFPFFVLGIKRRSANILASRNSRPTSVHSEMKDNGSLSGHYNPSFGVYSTIESETTTSFMNFSDLGRSSGKVRRSWHRSKNKTNGSAKDIIQNGRNGATTHVNTTDKPYGLVIGLMGYKQNNNKDIYAVPKKPSSKRKVYGLTFRCMPSGPVSANGGQLPNKMSVPEVPPRKYRPGKYMKHSDVSDSKQNLVKPESDVNDTGVDNPSFDTHDVRTQYDSKNSLNI